MAESLLHRLHARQLAKSGVAFLYFLSAFSVYLRAEGEVQSLKDFDYWDNGKVKRCIMYDITGRLKAKAFCRYDGTVEKVEKYDIYGNKVEEALYDDKGKLKAGIDGWAAMRWWYDGSQLLSQIWYDEYGRSIERKQYSEGGRLVFRQHRNDIDFDPYEEASMAMMLGGQNVAYYDSHRRLSERAEMIGE